eukprot:184479_1
MIDILFISLWFYWYHITLQNTLCPPNVQKYCMEGRQGFNQVINGQYVYAGCHLNNAYFKNQNVNKDVYAYIYVKYDGTTSIIIGGDYKSSLSYAYCEEETFADCSNCTWFISYYRYSDDKGTFDTSVYFGPNCSYALNTPSLCQESVNFASNVSISVAFDSSNISGVYAIVGCYDSQPSFKKEPSHNDGSTVSYLYYDYETTAYYISNEQGSISNLTIQCDMTNDTISNCLFFEPSVDYNVTIHFQNADGIKFILFCGLPIAAIFFVASCFFVCKFICKDRTEESTDSQISRNKTADIELQVRENKRAGNTEQKVLKSTGNKEERSPKKYSCKFIAKCIFVFIIKPSLEIYDYYTDIVVAIGWLNFYGLRNGTQCRVNNDNYAYSLIICSTIGFVSGIIGHAYSVRHSYCSKKRISYQSLNNLHQRRVNYFVLIKMFIEDAASMVILFSVAANEVSIIDMFWYFSYYTSSLSYAISAILLLRKELNSNCAICAQLYVPCKNERIFCAHLDVPHERTYCFCRWTAYGVFVVAICIVPWYFPLMIPFDVSTSVDNIRLGFGLNDNDCQIFEEHGFEYELGSVLLNEYSFAVDDDSRYSIRCWAHWSEYDPVLHVVKYGRNWDEFKSNQYVNALHCSMYDWNHHSNDKLCNFWMLENQCWSGPCLPYSENMTACFGYVGFAAEQY